MSKANEMLFKQVGSPQDGEYESDDGYLIIGNPEDGYRAESPEGKTIVMWSIDIPHARDTCIEHRFKNGE